MFVCFGIVLFYGVGSSPRLPRRSWLFLPSSSFCYPERACLLNNLNLMVNVVVQEWERQPVVGEVRLENIRQLFACFCADNDLLATRTPGHLQLAFEGTRDNVDALKLHFRRLVSIHYFLSIFGQYLLF